jgi:hypothetical protein
LTFSRWFSILKYDYKGSKIYRRAISSRQIVMLSTSRSCNISKPTVKQTKKNLATAQFYWATIAALTELFGARNFVFNSEFSFSGWRLNHNGHSFTVLTAKTKGTCFETEQDMPLNAKVDFFKELSRALAPIQITQDPNNPRTPHIKAALTHLTKPANDISI